MGAPPDCTSLSVSGGDLDAEERGGGAGPAFCRKVWLPETPRGAGGREPAVAAGSRTF